MKFGIFAVITGLRRTAGLLWTLAGEMTGACVVHTASARANCLVASMNGLGRLPMPSAICCKRSSRGDGAILLEQFFGAAGYGRGVPVLDQQPIGSLAAVAIAAHAHQNPTALQAFSVQGEFEIAAVERILR